MGLNSLAGGMLGGMMGASMAGSMGAAKQGGSFSDFAMRLLAMKKKRTGKKPANGLIPIPGIGSPMTGGGSLPPNIQT
jgi:hypothetical protein